MGKRGQAFSGRVHDRAERGAVERLILRCETKSSDGVARGSQSLPLLKPLPGALGEEAAEREVGRLRIQRGHNKQGGEDGGEDAQNGHARALAALGAAAIAPPQIIEIDPQHAGREARADALTAVPAQIDADWLDGHGGRTVRIVRDAQRGRKTLAAWVGRVGFSIDDDREHLAARRGGAEVFYLRLNPFGVG